MPQFIASSDQSHTASIVPISSTSPQAASATVAVPVIYTAQELLQGRREAWIEHGEQMYRLRLTHAGKLYLTK